MTPHLAFRTNQGTLGVTMPLHSIFFDAAGTLIHPAERVGAVYARHAAKWGVKTTADAMDAAFRAAWRAVPAPLHPEGSPPADDDRSWWREVVGRAFSGALGTEMDATIMDPLFEELYAFYGQPAAWEVYADVRPALEALHDRFELLVLSNFDRRLRIVLDGHDLARYFTHTILSSEVGASKPHARMFEAALRASTAPQASDCLHVGDDRRCDVEGAQQAGLSCFAVERPDSGLDHLVEKVCQQAHSGLLVACI